MKLQEPGPRPEEAQPPRQLRRQAALQGSDDQRSPIGQTEELFAILMRARKTEVEFVVYPGATHHLAESGRPSYRVDYQQRIADFVLRHLHAP